MTADAVGGVWTYAVELCRALELFGVKVALATMGPAPRADQVAEVAALSNVELHVSEYKLEWMDEPWMEVEEAGRWLLDLECRFRPDVIHLNGYAHGALRWSAPVLIVAHSCVLSWWESVRGERAPQEWHTYAERIAAGLSHAHMVVAPTMAMLAATERNYGRQISARVISNARTPECFQPGKKRHYILSAGRLWDEAKNVESLAFVAENLKWPVCLAGDCCPPESTHPEYAEACSAPSGNVKYLGHLPPSEFALWLSGASIYALPARYEPFGLSVLEAALAGCALVLGDIPSLREIWGSNAVYVPPDVPAALEHELNQLIEDPALRYRLGAAARQRALNFTPSKMAQEYVRAYTELMNPVPLGVATSDCSQMPQLSLIAASRGALSL